MRIAHVTTDEVNQDLAVQVARSLGAVMIPLGPEAMPTRLVRRGSLRSRPRAAGPATGASGRDSLGNDRPPDGGLRLLPIGGPGR